MSDMSIHEENTVKEWLQESPKPEQTVTKTPGKLNPQDSGTSKEVETKGRWGLTASQANKAKIVLTVIAAASAFALISAVGMTITSACLGCDGGLSCWVGIGCAAAVAGLILLPIVPVSLGSALWMSQEQKTVTSLDVIKLVNEKGLSLEDASKEISKKSGYSPEGLIFYIKIDFEDAIKEVKKMAKQPNCSLEEACGAVAKKTSFHQAELARFINESGLDINDYGKGIKREE